MRFLIVGANSDVAKALSKILVSKGHDLILLSRDIETLKLQKRDLETKFKREVVIDGFDVYEEDKIKGVIEKYGDIDCLVYVAGYLGDNEKALSDIGETEKIVRTNYLNPIYLINGFAKLFEKRGSGIIVGFSSVAGDRGKKSNFIYGSAKGGFSIYLQGLRNYLFKRGVKVITVKPGFIRTKMTEHMELPGLLTASPERVAMDVYRGILKGKDVIYSKRIWRIIMIVVKFIPEKIFKRMSI